MKAILVATLLIAAAVVFTNPCRSFAQAASDTLYVPPLGPDGQPDLYNVIMGDTTNTGQRNDPNRVYVLQTFGSPDTVYFLTNTITMTIPYNLTIVGKINPATGHPPVIEPLQNASNTAPDGFVECDTGNVSLDNLYLLGERPDGIAQTDYLVIETGNYTTIRLDHCVIDNFYGGNTNLIQHQGVYDNLYITNCEFRNIQSSEWPKGAIYWELTKGPVDTLWYENDTFFCVNGSYYGSNWDAEYIRFEHNTCFLNSGPPMKVQQAVNEDIEDNIFYGLVAHAGDSTQAHTAQFGGGIDSPNLVVIDTLGALAEPPFNLTETDRHVNVTNNVYCWPQPLVTLWHQINDTTSDSLLIPVFMDASTQALFADKTKEPGLYAADNDSVDPGFSSSLTAPALDSIVEYEYLTWSTGNVGSYTWSQLPTDPSNLFAGVPSNWAQTQGYPVPENLTYSDAALQTAGTDGKPLGDLNWYPKELSAVRRVPNAVPTDFNLSQNYPNPFNPSTEISVSLKQAGVMSLKVYNVLGEVVDVVVQGYKPAGVYSYDVNMDQFASGVYFYTLREGANMLTKKMVLLK